MKPANRLVCALAVACVAFAQPIFVRPVHAADACRTLATVSIAPDLSDHPVSGRLLVFFARPSEQQRTMLEPSFFDPSAVYVAGLEIHNLEPGKTISVTTAVDAFPRSIAEAPAGAYDVQAILDLDHSFTYSGAGDGDLYSDISKVAAFDPSSSEPVALTLAKRNSRPQPPDTDAVKLVTFESPGLSAFWGRPVEMRAGVILPPSYATSPKRRYPVVYQIHGFGGSHRNAWRMAPGLVDRMAKGETPEMIYVVLDGTCPLGHHEFADSVNNGPWGRALTTEFIPYLEKAFRMDGVPRGRLLTGHSSGGWSTLWLQVTYPDVFGGTWSTSPDPVDFRSFTGPDLTKPESENMYVDADGKPRNLARYKGRNILSIEEFGHLERVLGHYGGQFASFEAVFSPKGPDGQPMPLFDRETGKIDPFVAKAWERYDISRILRNNWSRLGPKLKGKIHIIVGSDDTFHLEAAVALLQQELEKLGSDAAIEFVPGRDHMDLYQGGLADRIANEIYATARPGRAAGKK